MISTELIEVVVTSMVVTEKDGHIEQVTRRKNQFVERY